MILWSRAMALLKNKSVGNDYNSTNPLHCHIKLTATIPALIVAMALLICFSVVLPVPAEELPVVPMLLMGQVLYGNGNAVTAGDITVYIESKAVGSGEIFEQGFAAEVTPDRADQGKPLTFMVAIDGKKYDVKSEPAYLTYIEGIFVEGVVLTLDTFGDKNGDGIVNILDLQFIYSNLGPAAADNGIKSDVNGDGQVDILDLLLVAQYIGN